ncbi:MFS transporter [Brevundimonas sp. AJA228-03]|uniref:MFS transporter n=1 Tax=Brevundimonas sp. AJA228-03 TaxID=2752515 RepID=UPI001AE0C82C|nr:MFS transporter [Brevundimonas sp. AJA228-03]QTN18369.1 MFS transporter [Brevundimonas sp. AJA228-03]
MTEATASGSPATAPAKGKPKGLLSLSLMGIPLTALSLPLVVMIPEHYATVLGLPLAVVGLIFTSVRIFDIVVDPLLGAAMDRTRSRWGRYRPWLIFGAPALMLAVYLLFMASPGVGPIYLLLTLTAAFLGWSILSLAQLALASGLAGSYDDRSKVYAWLQFASLLGILTVMGFPLLLKSIGDTGMAPTQIMGWIIIILMAPAVALAAWRVPEAALVAQKHIVGLKEYLAVVRRKAVFRIAAIDLLFGLGFGTASAMLVFFVTAAKGLDRSAVGVVLIAQVVTAMITVPAVALLARKLDKHIALGISGLLAAIVSVAFVFVPDGSLLAVSLGMMGWGLSFGAFNLLPRAMMADAGDELRLESGSDQTGVLFALLISSWKLGGALAVGLSFVALALVGYKPALMMNNTPEAIAGLEMVFAGPSALLFLLGAWLAFTYPLTRDRHAVIRAELDARDARSEVIA